MSRKFLTLLGLAQRSNNLISGENTCEIFLKRNAVKLILICEDASNNTLKKFIELCKNTNTPYIIYGDRNTLSAAIGKTNRAIYGIKNDNFAKKLLEIYKEINI